MEIKIGRHKYNLLKGLEQENLNQKELKQIQEYEKERGIDKEAKEKLAEYYRKVHAPKEEKIFKPTVGQIFNVFSKQFKNQFGKDFIKTEDTLENLKVLLYYFAQDPKFFESELLRTNLSEPSFDKGLLIVGGFGIGKTAIMETFAKVFKRTSKVFKSTTANNVVDDYEKCENSSQKSDFWKKLTMGTIYFDDVKTERIANNYGNVNIFKDVIEKRYSSNNLTFITCNYKFRADGDINQALEEFGELYGGRVYDRLFAMFNIIEFGGKSFRR
jgi:DNA replication protein DnaC